MSRRQTSSRWVIGLICLSALLCRGENGVSQSFYDNADELIVERSGTVIERLRCQRTELSCPGLEGRGEVNLGRTNDGSIYAAVTSWSGKGFNQLFRSTDQGKSWTGWPIQLPPGSTEVTAFTVLRDGTFLLADGGNLRGDRSRVQFSISRDFGQTWQPVGRIAPDPWNQIGEGFLSLTQLRDGTVVFPVARWNKAPEGTPVDLPHYVFRSTNGGKRWKGGPGREGIGAGPGVAPSEGGSTVRWPGMGGTFPGCLETHLIQLRCGSLLAAFRYSGYAQPWHKDMIEKWGGSPKPDDVGRYFKHVFLGDSTDGGKTWRNLRPVSDAEGRPLLKSGEAHGQLAELPDGRIVLTHDRRYDRQTVGRVSSDRGQTWSPEVYRLLPGSGYSASVSLGDGTVITVSGGTNERKTPSVMAIRWKPSSSSRPE